MKYVIIGSCIAACGAVEGIRSADQEGHITIIDGEKRGAYTRPLISYWLSEPKKYSNIDYRPPEFFDNHQVNIIKARAKKIDRNHKLLYLDNNEEISYDRLLLATGANSFTPPIPGRQQNWVRSFYTLEDVEKINQDIQEGQNAVIIGTGLIGMKAAEAFLQRGLSVHMVEKENRILPRQLSPHTACFVNQHLSAAGIQIITGDEVASIHPENQVELGSGKKLPADMVIMAVGTRPCVKLAVDSGLTVRQGITVDQNMRTSDDDIFAAGDAAETRNIISGQVEVMALLPHAHREGYLAGCAMAGKSSSYQGGIFMNAVKLMGWSICSAGNPGEQAGTTLTWCNHNKMLELLVSEGYLNRYITVNLPEISGPLTNIAEKRIRIAEGGWQAFIEQGPTLSNIPPGYWQEIRRLENNGSSKCS